MQSSVESADIKTSFAAGLGAGMLAFLVLLAYTLGRGYETLPQSSDALVSFLGFFALGTVVTVGTPVALYLRFRLFGPFGVLLADILFWGVLADGGDAPGYYFAVALWPAYLGLYLVVAFVEHGLRTGTVPFARTFS